MPLALHALPAQHGWPVPPHAAHEPATHTPVEQTLPQHGWPTAPHAAHVPPVWQTAPVVHIVPQHGWLLPPHGAHLLAEHR